MKRKSSRAWLNRQSKDPYVQMSKAHNYRSRASFKLLEILQKHPIIHHNQTIVDLGAAPGSWSQIAAKNSSNQVIAIDRLAMQPLPNVTLMQGDFTDATFYGQLQKLLQNRQVNIVISDLAPNISGIKVADQARAIELNELTLNFCQSHLMLQGHLICKIFQGVGTEQFIKQARQHFSQVALMKPSASRKESAEFYLIGLGFKHNIKQLIQ